MQKLMRFTIRFPDKGDTVAALSVCIMGAEDDTYVGRAWQCVGGLTVHGDGRYYGKIMTGAECFCYGLLSGYKAIIAASYPGGVRMQKRHNIGNIFIVEMLRYREAQILNFSNVFCLHFGKILSFNHIDV